MKKHSDETAQPGKTETEAMRKTILLLKPFPPYPLDCGSNILTYNLLKALHLEFDVTLLTRKPECQEEARHALQAVCKHVVFCEPPNLKSRPRRLGYAIAARLKAYFDNKPLAALYAEIAFRNPLRELLSREGYDLIQLDYWNVARLRAVCPPRTPCCLLVHDVQADLMEQGVAFVRNALRRRAMRKQAERVRRFEREHFPGFHHLLTVTEHDAEVYRSVFAEEIRVAAVPVIYERKGTQEEDCTIHNTVLFVGAMRHKPNVDAVRCFIEQVWPKVVAEAKDGEFWVVGRHPPRSIRALASSSVQVIGDADAIEPYLNKAAVYVAPLRFGSGIKIKILEALAHGKALVTSSVGAQGLALRHDENCLIADEPEDFAQCVISLLNNDRKRSRLATAGMRLIREQHSMETAGPRIRALYTTLFRSEE